MLTDAAKAQIKAAEDRKLAFSRGEGPATRLSARSIGDMSLIDVGCTVWAKTEEGGHDLSQVRMNSDGEARGGLVVEVTDHTEVTEDGEIVKRRAFRCLDPYLGPESFRAWTLLEEANVDLAACEPPQLGRIRSMYRRACAHVGKQKGNAHADETDLVIVAARLAALVAQRGHR